MTKIRETRNTSMIDDRRGRGGGAGGGGFPGLGGGGGLGFPMKAGGGIIGVIVMIAVIVLPQILGGEGTSIPGLGTPSLGAPVGEAGSGNSDETCDDELESILCGATIDVQEFWIREFEAAGREYPVTKTVFFSGFTNTGCGNASAETGPFYCPADNLVYFDLDFLVQLQQQFGATGDLASQYIVAHEYGHHVQNVLGISDQVREAQRDTPSRANEYSVALELQADCLAGVWAHDADRRGQFDRGEIAEALEAAAAVGDDRIQLETQGRTDPETFTHGTSEQRQTWFTRGFETGDIDRCNTFDG